MLRRLGVSAMLVVALLGASGVGAKPSIIGFRSARFGMTEAEVRNAIAKDFPSSAVAIEARDATATTPRLLAVPLIRLNPGPTPATVAYALIDGKLAQVDVTWIAPGEATLTQREGLAVAGERLRTYFETMPQQPATVVRAGVLGPNRLLLYGARDAAGASIEAVVDGISFDRVIAGKTLASPTPQGPATLRVSYRASNETALAQR